MCISKLCPSVLTSKAVCFKLSFVLAVILSIGCEPESSLYSFKSYKGGRATKIETADEYLDALDGESFFIIDYQLPDGEEKELIAELQSRYEFESIRDRLGDSPVADFEADSEMGYEFYSDRRHALQMLHSQHVAGFVEQDGFGVGRGGPPINSRDLHLFEMLTKRIERRDVGSEILDEDELDEYTLAVSALNRQLGEFSSAVNDGFATMDSIGFVRNVDEVAGFDAHRFRVREGWGGSIFDIYSANDNKREVDWVVNQVQLVGLLMHDEPVAYVSENLPDMSELSSATVQVRQLSPFELSGLEKLKSGEDLHLNATVNRVEMLGALRASNECMQCHAVDHGALLGAFSYEVLRDPILKPTKNQVEP